MNQGDLRPQPNGWRMNWNEPIRQQSLEWAKEKLSEIKTPRVKVYWDGHGDPYVVGVNVELPEEPMALEIRRRGKVLKKKTGTKMVLVKKKHPITGEVVDEVWKEKKTYSREKVGGGAATTHLVVAPDGEKLVIRYDDQIRVLARRFIGWIKKKTKPMNFELRLKAIMSVYEAIESGTRLPEVEKPDPTPLPEKNMQSWRIEGLPRDRRHKSLADAIKASKRHHDIQKTGRAPGRKERGRRPSKETARRAHHSRGKKLDLYMEEIEKQGRRITDTELQALVDSGAFGEWKEAQRHGWEEVDRIILVDTFEGKRVVMSTTDGQLITKDFIPDPRDEEKDKKATKQKPIAPMDDCPF